MTSTPGAGRAIHYKLLEVHEAIFFETNRTPRSILASTIV